MIHNSEFHLLFGKNTIEVISVVRRMIFTDDEAIQKAMIDGIRYIGRLFGAIDCYILGDNHPLYFAHKESLGKFRVVNGF